MSKIIFLLCFLDVLFLTMAYLLFRMDGHDLAAAWLLGGAIAIPLFLEVSGDNKKP